LARSSVSSSLCDNLGTFELACCQHQGTLCSKKGSKPITNPGKRVGAKPEDDDLAPQEHDLGRPSNRGDAPMSVILAKPPLQASRLRTVEDEYRRLKSLLA
jgi:hypothetical protein